jgi:hypothetical protein
MTADRHAARIRAIRRPPDERRPEWTSWSLKRIQTELTPVHGVGRGASTPCTQGVWKARKKRRLSKLRLSTPGSVSQKKLRAYAKHSKLSVDVFKTRFK